MYNGLFFIIIYQQLLLFINFIYYNYFSVINTVDNIYCLYMKLKRSKVIIFPSKLNK